jgi:hypothetical protein
MKIEVGLAFDYNATLQRHISKNFKQIFPEKASVPISTSIYGSAYSAAGRYVDNVAIYKSLTDT